MGWKLYAIKLLICGHFIQKNINIRILQESSRKKIKEWMYLPIMYRPHVSTNYAALNNKI